MAEYVFVGVVEKNAAGFRLVFPDLPGFEPTAGTLLELDNISCLGLELHLRRMLADNQPIPAATPMDRILPDPRVVQYCRAEVTVNI